MPRHRALLVATIAFAVLYVAGLVVLGTPPAADDSGRQVAAWFREHDGNVRAWLWCVTVALPLLVTIAALIRERLPSPHRDIFALGAVSLAAQTAVQGWIWAGMSWHADSLAPATARTLLDVTSFWGPVLIGSTTAMLAPVVVLGLREGGPIPRWLGLLGGLSLAEQIVETITIFGKTGFIAPGGPMNVFVGATLFSVWLVCLAVYLARHPAAARA